MHRAYRPSILLSFQNQLLGRLLDAALAAEAALLSLLLVELHMRMAVHAGLNVPSEQTDFNRTDDAWQGCSERDGCLQDTSNVRECDPAPHFLNQCQWNSLAGCKAIANPKSDCI